MIFLFSYGTLQLERVQMAQFGRRLEGRPDALPNHRLTTITITGGTFPIVQRSPGDEVLGLIYQLSPAELAAADAYEGVEYARRLRTLKSGLTAWVYLSNEAV